jgi:hypothetical protein
VTGTLRLYRGIAVQEAAADSVIDAIRRDGLIVEGRFWSGLAVRDLKPRLEDLWRSSTLTMEITRPEDLPELPRICACADPSSAMYYACRHNRKGDHTASILIEFDADPDHVIVDGRDFLYTVIQLGNPVASREALERGFGTHVLRYADRAWSTPIADQSTRIACCDLATQDPSVIRAHASNSLVIGGRHSTRFSSALMVEAPVPPANVVSVERVDCRTYMLPDIDIDLDRSLGR